MPCALAAPPLQLQAAPGALTFDAAAWSGLLRHDYGVAKCSETGDVAAWKQLLLAFRTALTQLGTDQRRTPAFAQILLDEARAQM